MPRLKQSSTWRWPRREAWEYQKIDAQDSQLKRDARRPNTHFQRVCDAAFARFLEHVQGLEEDLRQRNQRGPSQRLKSLSIEDTRKVSSQDMRD